MFHQGEKSFGRVEKKRKKEMKHYDNSRSLKEIAPSLKEIAPTSDSIF